MSKEAAAASKVRIVEAASHLMRERGIEATSIADVMEVAGMTHGGFYKHFESKDELVTAALNAAFAGHVERFDRRYEEGEAGAAVDAYVAEYLSAEHVAHAGWGCPAAALGADAGRSSEAVNDAFARGISAIIERYVRSAPSGSDLAESRPAAIRRLAAMVGAVVIARGVGSSELAAEVLAACSRMDNFPSAPAISETS